jgi:RNA polymerase sigma-70 factor (ECF subfamily)
MRAYLHQALKYRIINEFRAENVRNAYKQKTFFYTVSKNDFSDELESKDLRKQIDKITNSLPEKCKEVFMLSRAECLSNKDISSDLRISVSTVEKHIGKALKIFRHNLHEYAVPY